MAGIVGFLAFLSLPLAVRRKTTKALAEESLEQGPKLTAKRSKWAGIRKMLGVSI